MRVWFWGSILAGLTFASACSPGGERCGVGDCPQNQTCSEGVCVEVSPEVPHEDRTDGWSDPPGTGIAFVLDTFSIADPTRGFDLDDHCNAPGDCVDNKLGSMGSLINDQLRQGLLGGETLLLIEISGIDEPFHGDDENVTLKLYTGKDADQPFFPANNFQIPQGEESCCEFLIRNESTEGSPQQAVSRLRARIENYQLSTTEPGSLHLVDPLPGFLGSSHTTTSTPSPELTLAHARSRLALKPNLSAVRDGLTGGALLISDLAQLPNPYCAQENVLCPRSDAGDTSTLDLFAGHFQPDFDADGTPGIDQVEIDASSRVTRCYDEGWDSVPPLERREAWTCALRPEMDDGYSIALQFSAKRATIKGISR